MGAALEDDPRTDGRFSGERDTLVGYLAGRRLTLVRADGADSRRPSGSSNVRRSSPETVRNRSIAASRSRSPTLCCAGATSSAFAMGCIAASRRGPVARWISATAR